MKVSQLIIDMAKAEFNRVAKEKLPDEAWRAAIQMAFDTRDEIAKLDAWINTIDFIPIGA